MAKPEWGSKHRCPSCGIKFYNMLREPPTCPACATVVERTTTTSRRSTAAKTARKPAPAKRTAVQDNDAAAIEEVKDDLVKADAVVEEGLAELEDEDGDEKSVIEDVTELGEDENDVAVVVDTAVDEKDAD